jgi:GAF domain-containing protein
MTPFSHLVARPLIGVWLAISPHSWRRRVMADDSPHVHARGTDPDRVLLAGDGAASGRGVLTHELGLPGFLARSLSALTGRAADIDIVVSADMTMESCRGALRTVDLFRFDVIVLTLGANEALSLKDIHEWRTVLHALLDDLEQRAPAATWIFLLQVPLFSVNPHFPSGLADIVDQHVADLNQVMQDLAALRPCVEVITLPDAGPFEREGPHLYQRWADGIAVPISTALDPARSSTDDKEEPDESARQLALNEMETGAGGTDPVLNGLAAYARRVFGMPIAAVTIIDEDVQLMKAVDGMDPILVPREHSFCATTIRHATHLVIEDAASDPRFQHYPTVTGEPHFRSYAGYPIESPDGRRIGALCVLDTAPRRFAALELELLRDLAQHAQERLWQQTAA